MRECIDNSNHEVSTVNKFRSHFLFPILFVLVLLGVFGVRSLIASASDPLQISENNPYPNCRYGVATLGNDQVQWVDDLGAGWHLNFGLTSASATNGAEFVRVIKVKQDKTASGDYLPSYTVTPPLTDSGLGQLVDAYPGSLWIVGNEVDRGPDPGLTTVDQGDMYPGMYARAYHDVYHFIKARDPLAQVGNSALVQITPGRLAYLDKVWNAYLTNYGAPMPVDVWNMHIYILPEVNPQGEPNAIANVALGTDPALGRMESYDPDGPGPLTAADTCARDDVYCFAEHDDLSVFAEHVVGMRTWMHEHGYRHRPLILSEFSILYPYENDGATCFLRDEFGQCFTPERVRRFMDSTFAYLETATHPQLGYPADNNRLVQQWLWFSVHNSGVGYVSNLINNASPPALNGNGQNFRTHVLNQPNYINLFPSFSGSTAAKTDGIGTVDVTLTALVGNNGTQTAGAFNVTFYKDAALSQAIGSTTIPAASSSYPGMTGCARRTLPATITWNDLTPGVHRFWVKVDSANQIPENVPGSNGEADNVMSGIVIVDGDELYLPAVLR